MSQNQWLPAICEGTHVSSELTNDKWRTPPTYDGDEDAETRLAQLTILDLAGGHVMVER